jgi:exonuclease SbcC
MREPFPAERSFGKLSVGAWLVEVAAQAGGRLDALFLDEGFGSLDASFLDVAIAELAHRATSGKMIGVITHVRGIAAEIETVLRVQHLAGGSVISRLSVGERERLMDDTLASGLLEAAG